MTSRLVAGQPVRWALDPVWAARLVRYARPARHGAILAGLIFAGLIAAGKLPFPVDAHAYWAADPAAPYHVAGPQAFDGYFYSPVFVQLLAPFKALPWTWFAGLWTLLGVATLAWLSGRYLAVVILLPPVFIEVAMGNIHLLLGAAIVIGMRYPAAWAFVLFTKVTPAVGLLWFAVRGEWRNLAIALGCTAVIAGVSFALAPALWSEWFAILASRSSTDGANLGPYAIVPLTIRIPIAAAIVIWAARTDRAWLVPVAGVIALPVLWPNAFALAVGAILLLEQRPQAGAGEGLRGTTKAS
jgi:hypothetical protein